MCCDFYLEALIYFSSFPNPRSLGLETFKMPIPMLATVFDKGIDGVPSLVPVIKVMLWLGLLYVAKWYFGGASNVSERLMKSKVVMVTV